MEYNHITKFLDKFKKILFEKEEINKKIIEIISKHTSFTVEKNSVKIKNTIVYVQCTPIFKNEILINKNKILNSFKEEISNYNLTDIR